MLYCIVVSHEIDRCSRNEKQNNLCFWGKKTPEVFEPKCDVKTTNYGDICFNLFLVLLGTRRRILNGRSSIAILEFVMGTCDAVLFSKAC